MADNGVYDNSGMRRNTKRRSLLYLGLGLGVLSLMGLGGFANAFMLVGAGVYALREIRARGGVAEALRSFLNSDQSTRGEDLRRETDLFNNLTRKWNFSKVPIGLELEGQPSNLRASFSYNGVPHAVSYDDRVLRHFSVFLADEDIMRRVSEKMSSKGLSDMVSVVPEHGGYRLSTKNAGVALEIASAAFSSRELKVERELSTVSRYVVGGCSSYEEAEETCRRQIADGSIMPSYQFSVESDRVDGKEVSKIERGELGTFGCLPVDTFVVDVSTVDGWSDVVKVRPDNTGVFPDEIEKFAAESFVPSSANQVKDGSVDAAVYSDGLEGCDVKRYVRMDGNILMLDPYECSEPLYCVMKFDSFEDLQTVADKGDALGNATVVVERGVPSVRDGEYVLAVPADEEFIRSLSLSSEDRLTELRHALPKGSSYKDEDLSYLLMMDDLRRDGYIIGNSRQGIDFSRAEVNGIPYQELSYHLQENPDLQDEEFRREWLRDQRTVHAVSMSVDATHRELVVTSEVSCGGSLRRIKERYALRPDEMISLNERLSRDVSLTDMKDVVMRSHPELFPCYGKVADNNSNPVMEFIRRGMEQSAGGVERTVRVAPVRNIAM